MMKTLSRCRSGFAQATRRSLVVALAVGMSSGLVACSGNDGKSATQVAAQVNGEEISVHQINFALQRTPGVTPERAPQAKKAILERLIEQQVLVQAADANKLDRDPEVLQRLEAGKREILARAYLERVAIAVQKPDAAEVAAYFAAQPQLFENRKVYKTDEIVLPGRPKEWAEIEKELAPTKTIDEAAAVLRAHRIDAPIATNATRASEQIPLSMLPQFERLKTGDLVVYPQAPGIVIAQIRSIRDEPVDEKRAGPVIEQFLMNRKRNEAVQAEMKRLRQSAQVTYLGDFLPDAPQDAPAAAPSPSVPLPAADETGMDKGVKGLR